jgi:hypothetical protein
VLVGVGLELIAGVDVALAVGVGVEVVVGVNVAVAVEVELGVEVSSLPLVCIRYLHVVEYTYTASSGIP